MNIIITILLIVAGIITLLLILGLFMRRNHYVKRAIIIQASRQKVFDFLRFLKNQDAFNKHAMTDPDRVRDFKGTDGTVGYIYAWSGDKKAGVGEKEIINIVDGKTIETEIRFTKPMKTSARMIMELESLSDNETRVYWSNAGTLSYPFNIMIPLFERMVPKDMDTSLATLKGILEK
ncbi:SRPBCC family protein [Chitinophagaceae bacterium MMS25-I14]